ncbi:hypothetical protein BX600DRAFT_511472 [Xylariales sp. PMI_506]|nr:hypothetical protein BX600DRAFT_511472 [Xylariales sp. PMI_506]
MGDHAKFNVLVIGAGPVGLMAAAGLSRDHHHVTVLERHPDLQATGGDFVIQTAAVGGMKSLGFEPMIASISRVIDTRHVWSYKDGEKPLNTSPLASRYSTYITARADFQRMAYDAAISGGATVVFNQLVTRVDTEESPPRVWTQAGNEYSADMVIAADGIKSAIRQQIFAGESVAPIPTTEGVFQSKVDLSKAVADPRLAPLLRLEGQQACVAPNRFVIFRKTVAEKLEMNHVVFEFGPPPDPEDIKANWNTPADPQELRRLFADFAEPFRAYLEHITKCTMWRIAYSPTLPRWRSQSGLVLLLGDAAHAMAPHGGNGLGQGLEDVTALVRILRRAPPDSNAAELKALLEHVEALRKPRADKIAKVASETKNQRAAGGNPYGARGNSPQQVPSDWSSVKMDANAPTSSIEFIKWMRDYDIAAEADQVSSA